MIIRGSPYGVDPRSAVEMELTVLDVSDQARQILRTSRLLGGEHTSGVNICNMLIMKDKALSLDRNWHDGRDPCEKDRAVLTSNRRSTLHAHDRLLTWCACCCSTKAVLLHHEMQGLPPLERLTHDGRDPCEKDRAGLTSNRRSTLHAHDRLLIWCACCCSTQVVLLHHEMQGLQRSST